MGKPLQRWPSRLLPWIGWLGGLMLALALPQLGQATLLPLQRCPLPIASPTPTAIGWDAQLWGEAGQPGDRAALLQSIRHSLTYLNTPAAAAAYRSYPVPGITRDRVQRSLERFQTLLITARSPAALQAAVAQEFDWYQSVGRDGLGTVDFTGYFEPTYTASRVPTADYRYPLYRLPPDLATWRSPHPTRPELEGRDGLQGSAGRLRGLELVWLRDRLEAFLVQVQGSARLQLTDGTVMTVGYAGRTDYPYTSVGRQLVDNGVFSLEELTLPRLIAHFQANPAELDQYLPNNQRFVFFKATDGAPATGSLSVPVTAGRSIATDKSLMPPGAIALIHAPIPQWQDQAWVITPVSRYVLDQDTGGAIQGAGRVDIFLGTGATAGTQAGLLNGAGQLFYLLLKE